MIDTKMLIMRPDCPHETRTVTLAPEPLYRALSNLIIPLLDGANLEHVSVLADFAGGFNFIPLDMFVDETSAIKKLPRNEAATVIYRRATMLGESGAPIPEDPESLPAIYGPAVLFNRRVWF